MINPMTNPSAKAQIDLPYARIKQPLCGILADIAEIASFEIAVQIAHDFGGQRFTIGRSPRARHPFARYLSQDELSRLGDRIMGDRVEIPTLDLDRHIRSQQRMHIAYELFNAHWSVDAIARNLQIGRRWVRRLIAQARHQAKTQQSE